MNISTNQYQFRCTSFNLMDCIQSADPTKTTVQEINSLRMNAPKLFNDVLTETSVRNYTPESVLGVMDRINRQRSRLKHSAGQ